MFSIIQAAGWPIWPLILCSIVARGGRFFVVAVLLNRYGDPIRNELEKRLGLWVAIGAIVLVLRRRAANAEVANTEA